MLQRGTVPCNAGDIQLEKNFDHWLTQFPLPQLDAIHWLTQYTAATCGLW